MSLTHPLDLRRFGNLYGTRYILRKIIKQQEKEQDCLIMITGKEGKGKSTLMAHIMRIIEEEKGIKINPNDSVAFRLKDFFRIWGRAPKFAPLCLDEGKELMGINFQKQDVKTFEEKMTSLRIESHIYIICITNPFRVMKYVKEDKKSYIFHCMNRRNVKIFNASEFNRMIEDIKDFKSTALLDRSNKYIFSDSFGKAEGEFWDQYSLMKKSFAAQEKALLEQHRELEYSDDVVKEIRKAEGTTQKEVDEGRKLLEEAVEPVFSMSTAAKLLSCSTGFLRRGIIAGTIKGVKSCTGEYRLPASELNRLRRPLITPLQVNTNTRSEK